MISKNSHQLLIKKLLRHLVGACCAILISIISPTILAAELPKILAVEVSGLDSDANDCNLNDRNTAGPVSAALRYNRIEESDNSLDPQIIVYLNVMNTKSTTCVWSMRVTIVEYQNIEYRYSKKSTFSAAQLCSQVFVGRTARTNMAREYNDSVKQMVDACLNEIQEK